VATKLVAYRMLAARRVIVDGLMSRLASKAKNAATVSGSAGSAATPFSAHQDSNRLKSL
jgi:hypothetical protein